MIMTAVPFDTLKFARHLEESGLAASAAAGAAEALADALIGADLATKSDIGSLRTELQGDTTSLRAELKGDIAALRAEVMNAIELLRRDITIKFGSMMVISVGILLAAIRYLPPHP
ncbi:MAG: hypothetical protein ABSA58_10935 [Acetobacteraceae bacterium]